MSYYRNEFYKIARPRLGLRSLSTLPTTDGTDFSITGRAIVTGGAGAYKKAKGNLKLVGAWNKTTKKFSMKFIGKLTV